jgi:hypothetical protein
VPLDERLLARFDRCLSDQRLPWLASRRPSRPDAEITQLATSAGIQLPPELRLWWSWFNGVSTDERVEITPVMEALALETAILGRADMQAGAAELAASSGRDEPRARSAERLWLSSLLPLFGTGGDATIAADAGVGPATPLHMVWWQDGDHPVVMVAPSLGDAVHRWVEMYEAGYYRWDVEEGDWDFRALRVRPAIPSLQAAQPVELDVPPEVRQRDGPATVTGIPRGTALRSAGKKLDAGASRRQRGCPSSPLRVVCRSPALTAAAALRSDCVSLAA